MCPLPREWLDARLLRTENGPYLQYFNANKRASIVRMPDGYPYYFIRDSDVGRAKDLLVGGKIEPGPYVTLDLEPAVKVEFSSLDDAFTSLRNLRAASIPTMESDFLTPSRLVERIMIDFGIRQCPLDKVAYLDIEVEAVEERPDVYQAANKILSVAVAGSDGKEFFLTGDREHDLFGELKGILLKNYQVVTGWNWTRFDYPYLVRRAMMLGERFSAFPLQDVDLLFMAQRAIILLKIGGTGSMKLERFARDFLGVEHWSAKTVEDFKALYESFKGDKKLLRAYNMTDAKITRELDKKLGLMGPYLEIASQYPGIPLRNTTSMALVWDAILLRKALERDIRVVFPPVEARRTEERLVGGGIIPPIPGVHRKVIGVDFKSLYPAIIFSYGLSPETVFMYRYLFGKSSGEIPIDLRKYLEFLERLKEAGLLPILSEAMMSFIERRERAKKEGRRVAEMGYKLLQVSAYGAIGRSVEKRGEKYYESRFPGPLFYNTVTAIGRKCLESLKKEVEERGWRACYGDSDSCFAECPKESLLALCVRAGEIAKDLTEGVRKKMLEVAGGEYAYNIVVEPKGVYETVTFPFKAKKRYRGEGVWRDGKFERWSETVGLEIKRADAFSLLKEAQERVISILSEVSPEEIEERVREYLQGIRERIFSGGEDEKLIITKNLRKGDLESYDREDPHIRVARKLEERGYRVQEGDISWVVVERDNGKMVEEPILPGNPLPAIKASGRQYYYDRILDMVSRLLGCSKKELARGEGLDRWIGKQPG